MLQPRKSVVLAFDGPGPLAKLITQRKRRLKASRQSKYKMSGLNITTGTELMLAVHHKGRAVVSSGSRERAEFDVYRLHEHGLWATLEHESL